MIDTQVKIPQTEYLSISIKRGKGETLESIAKPYGASRERIRQILRDYFPGITAEVAKKARKNISNRKRKGETKLCACGCETIIPAWSKDRKWWRPARRYVSGHQGRNRVPYKRTLESLAKSSASKKKDWAEGKYDNKIRKDTIEIRRKLWKILKKHPEGITSTDIVKITGIKRSTLNRWIRRQQYIKFTIHQKGGHGQPYVISLASEPSVNLEDEMCSPHLHLGIGIRND